MTVIDEKKKKKNVASRAKHFAHTFAIIKSTLLLGNLDSSARTFPIERIDRATGSLLVHP